MSKSAKQPMENAVEIIERFGGIRPMASKIDVAVTTIQGWKKRNVIPGTRRALVLSAAKENGIDLSGLLDDGNVQDAPVTEIPNTEEAAAPVDTVVEEVDAEKDVNNSEGDKPQDSEQEEKAAEPVTFEPKKKVDEFKPKQPQRSGSAYTELAVETRSRAITQSAMIAASIVFFMLALIVMMMWPKFEKNYDEFEERGVRIAELENNVSDIQESQNGFKGLVPENWSEQLDVLKKQAEIAKKNVGKEVHEFEKSSKKFLHETGMDKGIEKRVEQLQDYVSEISAYTGYGGLISRYDGMRDGGQGDIDQSVEAILPVLKNMDGKSDQEVNEALADLRDENPALQATLGDVPISDLKAAAMLMAMTEIRSALYRDEAQFDDDLELLKAMVGNDDPELLASLDKLAPQAKDGSLTQSSLMEDFQSFKDDIITSSLTGSDVSFGEKMAAKFNDLMKVEKDGELLTGTETQAKMNYAEKLMKQGKTEDAMAYLKKSLTPPQLKVLDPWFLKVEARLQILKVQNTVEQILGVELGGPYLGGNKTLR